MGIDITDLQPATSGWALAASSADLRGCEVLKAAPTDGTSIYLTSIAVSSGSTMTITVGEGEAASAVVSPIFEAMMVSAWRYAARKYKPAIKLTADTALTVDSDGAGSSFINAEGYSE